MCRCVPSPLSVTEKLNVLRNMCSILLCSRRVPRATRRNLCCLSRVQQILLPPQCRFRNELDPLIAWFYVLYELTGSPKVPLSACLGCFRLTDDYYLPLSIPTYNPEVRLLARMCTPTPHSVFSSLLSASDLFTFLVRRYVSDAKRHQERLQVYYPQHHRRRFLHIYAEQQCASQ
jgi:hypothetical protein